VSVPLWGWALTIAAVGVVVGVDIRQARRPHAVGFREALTWSGIYVGAAIVFGLVLIATAGSGAGTAFFAGYLVEKSLSVDNLFVFAVILSQFAVPPRHQQRVLLLGVLGALVLRAVFIAAGAAVIERFTVTFIVFGAFLLYTAVHLVRAHGATPNVTDSRAVRLLRRVMPVTDSYREDRLFTRLDGRRAATPLLVVIVAILSIDILFALDSIPAIFGITDSAYLVFTANVFALLGLRALYFLLVGLLDRLVHLHYGLAAILGFIGIKLVLHYLHTIHASIPEISTGASLLFVLAALTLTTMTSLRASRDASLAPSPADDPADRDVYPRPSRRDPGQDRNIGLGYGDLRAPEGQPAGPNEPREARSSYATRGPCR
jgi:tellurite resistance protein TerC